MLAHLLLFADFALLALIARQLSRHGSTQTQVAGDQVTPEVLKAAIAETDANVAELARELHTITQVLRAQLTAELRSTEQEGLASVCNTGGHRIHHRVR